MGKFNYLPSNVNVVVRIVSVKEEKTKFENLVAYNIMATQDGFQDPKTKNVPSIIIHFIPRNECHKKCLESLQPGDIIECLGSMEGSVFNDKGKPVDIYEIFWQNIKLVYEAS